MPPTAPSPKASPAEQVRFYLARSRQHGVPFRVAWRSAIRRVRWPHDTEHRREWKVATVWSEEYWRRAYEGVPDQPVEHAVAGMEPIAA